MNKNSKILLYVVFVQALVATLGSLYYSEIKHYAPCILCWYQRIFMYPLIISSAVSIIRKDKLAHWYLLPPAILGFFFALYHVLLQRGVLPESIAPCVLGASCVTKHVGYFGFITIPVMSLTAFTVIIIALLMFRRARRS